VPENDGAKADAAESRESNTIAIFMVVINVTDFITEAEIAMVDYYLLSSI